MKKGCYLWVKVIPRAAQSALVGWENEVLKIRLHAVPEKGKANEALLSFLSSLLKIPKTLISIVQGETNPRKRLFIDQISEKDLLTRLPKR